MSFLNKPYETYERPGLVVSYKVAASTQVYKGALLGLDASGYAIPVDQATYNSKFIGIAAESVDNSVGAAGAKSVNVTKSGSFVFKAGESAAQANLGMTALATSDWEVVTSASGLANSIAVGTVVGLETTSTGAAGYRIRIDSKTL
jgi:predicted secreted protein